MVFCFAFYFHIFLILSIQSIIPQQEKKYVKALSTFITYCHPALLSQLSTPSWPFHILPYTLLNASHRSVFTYRGVLILPHITVSISESVLLHNLRKRS